MGYRLPIVPMFSMLRTRLKLGATRHIFRARWYSAEKVPVDQGQQIVFSQNWEDINAIRSALRIKDGEKVFSVAGCGDNVLALLLDNPGRIEAIDISQEQIDLCRLKIAAVRKLKLQEVRDFIGIEREGLQPEDRLYMYESLRPDIPHSAQKFFDDNIDEVKNGVMNMGVLEKSFQFFRTKLLPLAHDEEHITELLSQPSLEEQRRFVETVWDTNIWADVYRLYITITMTKIKKGPVPEDVDLSYAWIKRFGDRLRNILVQNQNYFVEYFLTGKITGRCGLPPYLQEENFPIIRSRLDRIGLTSADILQYLNTYANFEQEKFDCLSLSNVSDWFTDDEHERHLLLAVGCAKPGSRILFWNLAGQPRSWPRSLLKNGVIQVDKVLSSILHQRVDRFYSMEPPKIAHLPLSGDKSDSDLD